MNPDQGPSEVFLVWIESFRLISKVHACRIEEIGVSIFNPSLVFEPVKDGMKKPLEPRFMACVDNEDDSA